MGEILPDGTIQGYFNICPKCKKTREVNIQGDSMGHECKDENLPIQHVRKSGCKFCGCESYTKRTQGILVCQRCNEDWQHVS